MRPVLAGLLTMLAVACTATPPRTSGPTTSPPAVHVAVHGAAFAPQASGSVAPLGVPGDVNDAELSVFDGTTELMFNADGRVVPNGQRVTLTPTADSKTLLLPGGKAYRFTLTARDARTPANHLAFGQVTQTLPASGTTTVTIPQTTLTDTAELQSVPAVSSVVVGQELTLKLFVRPPGRPDLRVPTGDYTVTYTVSEGAKVLSNGTPVESKLGVRVMAEAGATGTLTVTATVNGLRPPVPGTNGSVQATFSVPILANTGVTSDLTPPTVTLNTPTDVQAGQRVTLSGTASDNRGVTRVDVYDGVELLGSATMSGTTWSFAWQPTAGEHDLTVLAYDAAGNMNSASALVHVGASTTTAVYVSTGGVDGAAGTATQPLRTIQAGIARASASGGEVRVARGVYAESLTLASNVRILGGYDPNTWVRDVASNETVVAGGTTAVTGNGVSNVTLDGLTVRSADASQASARSSYALLLRNSALITVSGSRIQPGAGLAGAAGMVGAAGVNGSPGLNGAAGSCDASVTAAGGAGGLNAASGSLFGGQGGQGGIPEVSGGTGRPGAAGSGGTPGGAGGSAGNPGQPGSSGANGAPGASGAAGSGATASMALNGTGDPYVTATGTNGTNGTDGRGGGGGGGGGAQVGAFVDDGTGNGGGGGGAAGQGGRGATGGQGGGGSFGVVLIATTSVVLENNVISTSAGGNGGNGASGGSGGAGGNGGAGGAVCTSEVGAGGAGGRGGNGGAGGASGGGAGGPSIGILEDNASSSTRTSNTVTLGAGGAGGAGVASNAGAAGVTVAYQKLP